MEAFCRAATTGHHQPPEDWVVLVEEAAMMDTHRMAALLEAAGPASIRTLGDPEQAQPVGAGGWHQLIDQVIGGHAQLTQVIRQRNPKDREVCAAIRDGHAHQALANLRARGRLHLAPTRSAAIRVVGRALRLRHLRPSRWLSGTLAVLAAAWLAVLIVPSTPWALLELPVLVGQPPARPA